MNIPLNVFQTIIKDIRAMSLDIIQVPLLFISFEHIQHNIQYINSALYP